MTGQKMKKRLFGTNGVRGIIGDDMTPELVFSIGAALGTLRKGRIAVGRDTRTSGESLSKAVKAGLVTAGCETSDCGVLPTPALQYLVRARFDAGAMITASHNPPEYNGVKIIEPDGTEMGDEQILQLENIIFSKTAEFHSWNDIGNEIRVLDAYEEYISGVGNHFSEKTGAGMIVAVDPGSGPAYKTTPEILMRLGCRVVTINDIPDGTFPRRMPEPSPENLKDLASLVVSSDAAFGVAHDGDADRAVFIDEKGRFIEENQELALITQYICSRKKGIIVTPVSTSQQVEMVANAAGSSVAYTPVGSIYVARAMLALREQGNEIILGGEGNGGIIFPDHQYCRDGAMTAATLVSILAATKESLSDLVEKLPQRFMIKHKISCQSQNKEMVLVSLEREFHNLPHDLTDGLKIYDDDSWALIRPSGTEPIIRIVVDSSSQNRGNMLLAEIMEHIDTL